ncbi:MFS transporter, partial [Agromyces sp. MMS17-SY077]|nr:MFS transporter [Agromyces seonyuensis]
AAGVGVGVERGGTGGSRAAEAAATPRAGGTGMRRALVLAVLVALLLVGHYGAYTFLTRLAAAPAEALPGGVATMLLVFGAASTIGIALAGRVRGSTLGALAVSAAVTAAALVALPFAPVHPVIGIAVVAVWAIASGALPPLAQSEILRLAGPEHRGTAGALIPVLFNLGVAVGAALASVVVGTAGVAPLGPLAAAVVGAATLGILVVRAAASARVRRPAATGPDTSRTARAQGSAVSGSGQTPRTGRG